MAKFNATLPQRRFPTWLAIAVIVALAIVTAFIAPMVGRSGSYLGRVTAGVPLKPFSSCNIPQGEDLTIEDLPESLIQQVLEKYGPSEASSAIKEAAPAVNPFAVSLDLRQILGEVQALDGIVYHPHRCLPPLKDHINDASLLETVYNQLIRDIVNAVAQVKGVEADQIDPNASFFQNLGIENGGNPLFVQMRTALSNIVASYAVTQEGKRFCLCGKEGSDRPVITTLDQIGTPGECPDGEELPENPGLNCIGAVSASFLLGGATPTNTAGRLRENGHCTSVPQYVEGFYAWWIRERLYADGWKGFNVPSRDEDALLELMDMYYETRHIFLMQRWLGFAVMQDPFDLLALQNMIYHLRPMVLIETGTANGGSALLWASIFEMCGLYDSKIITIDYNHPSTGFGSTDQSKNPVDHPYWQKYITFVQGYSTEPRVIGEVTELVGNSTNVLVFLDSDHSQNVVSQELDIYCMRFVSVGSYCVAEDTKLSRMGLRPGPREAVNEFLASHPQFNTDRSAELVYSQHVGAFLVRVAT